MRKLLMIILFLSLYFNAIGQSWTKSNALFGDNNITIIKSTNDSQNSTILFGHFIGTITANNGQTLNSNGGRDYFVCKYNQELELQWIKNFGSTANEDVLGGVSVDEQDNIYITGGFMNSLKYSLNDSIISIGGYDIFLAKLDPDGNINWIKNFGQGIDQARSISLKATNNNELLIGGNFRDSISLAGDTTLFSSASFNGFFAKLNNSGNVIWTKVFNTISGTSGFLIYNIDIKNDNYLLSGIFSNSVNIYDDTISSVLNTADALVIKTDTSGSIVWKRKAYGSNSDFSYNSIFDNEGNVYFTGFFNSSVLSIETSDNLSIDLNLNNGQNDMFVSKYDSNGTLQWVKKIGGKGDDKIADASFFNNQINLSGLFSDTLKWGGIELTTKSINDQDMFIGVLDSEGNFRSSNSFSGRNNSSEDARSIFTDGLSQYTVIRTNTDLLVLEDSIYTSTSGNYFIAVGTIGCLPINIAPSKTDVTGCYGDETGTIFIGASGGFGGPFSYSIDDGNSYQYNDPNFLGLPAGVYKTVVLDNANCAQAGPEVIIDEPDTLMITNVASTDALCYGENGSIEVETSGGTGNVFFSTDNGATYPHPVGTPADLPEGIYNIMVRDANNCITEGPADTISQPASALQITLVDQSDISDEADGQIEVAATGGTEPYTFTLQPTGTEQATGVFTFAAGEGGDYTVELTDNNNCGPVSTATITITDFTNINDVSLFNASVYPNPSSGMITVEFRTDKQEMTLEVFSIDGRNVMSRQVYSAGGQVKETLDLSSLDKGMYFMRIDRQTLSSSVVLK